MITFKAFVPPRRRADGTYNVKIRCTHKRVSRWLPTTVFVTDADLTRSRRIKNPAVLAKCDALVRELREIVSELSPFAAAAMNVDEVVAFVRKKKEADTFQLDFFEYGRRVAAGQAAGTARNTLTALNAFARYIGKDRVEINEITGAMARGFVEFVDAEPKQTSARRKGSGEPAPKKPAVSSWKYTSILRSVFRKARDEYNDEDAGKILIPRAPFDGVRFREGVHAGQRNVGRDVLQRLIDARPASSAQRFAIDVFLLSFMLMGVNLADLYQAVPPADGVFIYERVKTRKRRRDRARMEIRVPAEAEGILARLRDPSGARWLRLWREGKDVSAVGYKVNYGLRRWAEEAGVEKFTFYAARHSWATLARAEAGVDKATVDDCLNHVGDMKTADIYIEKDFRVFEAANAKVLALFDWQNIARARI